MLDHGNVEAMTVMLLAQNTMTAKDKSLLVLPLFHVNAIMVSVVTPLAAGASAYIAGRFDAHQFWSLVEEYRPAFFSAVPAIYFFLTILPEDTRPDVSSLRFAVCGAAPMPADAIAAFEARYDVPVVEGYGLSEPTVALTANPIDERRPGTVGRPLDGIEAASSTTPGTSRPPAATATRSSSRPPAPRRRPGTAGALPRGARPVQGAARDLRGRRPPPQRRRQGHQADTARPPHRHSRLKGTYLR
jgi:long-chain acyl-CoA synthetase